MNKTKIEWTDELIAEQQRRNSERNQRGHPKRARKLLSSTGMGVPGYVYLIRWQGLCKIGLATDVTNRLKSIARQWDMSPGSYKLVHTIYSPNMDKLEAVLHSRFASKNTHAEWFDLTPIDISWIVGLGSELDDNQLERLASWERLRPRL